MLHAYPNSCLICPQITHETTDLSSSVTRTFYHFVIEQLTHKKHLENIPRHSFIAPNHACPGLRLPRLMFFLFFFAQPTYQLKAIRNEKLYWDDLIGESSNDQCEILHCLKISYISAFFSPSVSCKCAKLPPMSWHRNKDHCG